MSLAFLAGAVSAQNFAPVAVGSKIAHTSSFDKAPGDTTYFYPPAVDTCQSNALGGSVAFGTFSMGPVSVSAVGQKFTNANNAKVLAIGGYVQLIGSGSLTPYTVSVNGGTTTPGSALGTGAVVLDTTLNAPQGLHYVLWLLPSPVQVANDFYVVGTTTPSAAGDTIRYLLNADCASGNSFINIGTWANSNTPPYNLANDIAFETIIIEGTPSNFSVNESVIEVAKVMPNPASDFSVLVYNIKESAKVDVKILDITGKVVRQINEGTKQAGTYTTVLNLNELANGTYVYQVSANGHTTTGRLVVAK